jgi:hypothetical protein
MDPVLEAVRRYRSHTMIYPKNGYMCIHCGYEHAIAPEQCPLCKGEWQGWELLFAPHALDDLRSQVMGWIAQLPYPTIMEWTASPKGLRVQLYLPPHVAEGVVQSWSAMTGQHSRWRALGNINIQGSGYALHTSNRLPSLIASAKDSDPLLAIGSRLISAAREGKEASLRLWLLGNEDRLQEKLRSLSAYSYGTEGGVGNSTPNSWGMQLDFLRAGLFFGMIMAGISGGILFAGWFNPFAVFIFMIAGISICIASALGIRDWLAWRSIPKEVLELRTQQSLLKVAFSISEPINLPLFAGEQSWQPIASAWPGIQKHGFPLPAGELAGLIAPLQLGEGSGLLDRAVWQEVPAPPPSQPLLEAGFKIGQSVATGELVGVDPDGHGLATGGSRSGKSSFVFACSNNSSRKATTRLAFSSPIRMCPWQMPFWMPLPNSRKSKEARRSSD